MNTGGKRLTELEVLPDRLRDEGIVVAREEEHGAVCPRTIPQLLYDRLPPLALWEGIVEEISSAKQGIDCITIRQAKDPIQDIEARARQAGLEVTESLEALAEVPIRRM